VNIQVTEHPNSPLHPQQHHDDFHLPPTSNVNRSEAADYMPMTNTDDLATLAYLLQVQMDVQQRVIEAVVDSLVNAHHALPRPRGSSVNTHLSGTGSIGVGLVSTIGSAKTGSVSGSGSGLLRDVDLTNLPSLLQSSMKQVGDTVGKIVTLAESREHRWAVRHKKDMEKRRQLEVLLRGVSGNLQIQQQAVADLVEGRQHQLEGVANVYVAEAPSVHSATTSAAGGPDESLLFSSYTTADNNTLSVPTGAKDGDMSYDASEYLTDASEGEDDSDVFYDATDGGRSSISLIRTPSKLASSPMVKRRVSVTNSSPSANAAMAPVAPPPYQVNAEGPSSGVAPSSSSPFPDTQALTASCKGYLPATKLRDRLPLDPTKPKPSFNMWSFLKSAIGKDLSKVSLPVFFNEPLSNLQRMAEDVEYVELLSIASRVGSAVKTLDPADPAVVGVKELGIPLKALDELQGEDAQFVRLLFVSAFAMSNYSSTVGRTGKPFNPLLVCIYNRLDFSNVCLTPDIF
jgi:hypothetical protein